MARLKKVDLRIEQGLQDGEVLLARYAEHVFESLVLKTTD
jgi:hypothetical protein